MKEQIVSGYQMHKRLDHVICVKTSSWRSQVSLASFAFEKDLVTYEARN